MEKSFEDLEVWQRSRTLAVWVCRIFQESKNYGLRDQIMRSAISVPSNIAEGADRNTYLSSVDASAMLSEAKQLSRMLYRLAQSQQSSSS